MSGYLPFPTGVWTTTAGRDLSLDDVERDRPTLETARQSQVIGPSGHTWTWQPVAASDATGGTAMTDDQTQTPKPGEPEPSPPTEPTEEPLENEDGDPA